METTTETLVGRYLTLTEAGGRAGKSAKWAEDHIRKTAGAPTHLAIPEPGDVDGIKPKTILVREADWIEFLESFEISRLDRMSIRRPGTSDSPMPTAMMSPGQRRRAATGRA